MKFIVSISAILAVAVNCIDSPLSDIELTSFDVIKAEFRISKTFNMSSTSQSLCAYIWDKNGCAVRIKNGSVTVNGIELDYDNLFKCYNTPKSDVPVLKNALYTFIIALSNGDTSRSQITTPQAEFGTVIYPSPIHILQDSAISWSDFVGLGNTLSFNLQVDSDADSISSFETVLQRTIPDIGRFALTHDLFNPARHTGEGFFTLTRISGGPASNKLRGGSTIEATFEFSRNVTMTQ